MQKEIKFTANINDVKKELSKLTADPKIAKGPKIKFDIDDSKIKAAIKSHQEAYSNVQKEMRKTIAQMSEGVGDKQYKNLSRRLREHKQDLTRESQTIRDLGGRPGIGDDEEGGGSAVGGAGAMSVLKKAGIYGALAYAGYKAFGYAKGGVNAIESLSPEYSRMRALGMGMSAAQPFISEGTRRGIAAGDSRSLMGTLLTRTGSMDPGMFKQIQTMSRGYGLDTGMLGNMAGAIRQTGVSGPDLAKKNADIYATAFAAKIEKSRIGEYLSVTASTIEKMSGNAAGLETTGVAQIMAMLSRGGIMTPGFAASGMAAMDNLIKNPSGAQSPLVFNALAQTLAQGGYKGNMALGIQTLQSTGLGKPNLTASNFPALAASGKLGAFQDVYNAFDPVHFMKNIAGSIGSMSGKLQDPKTRALFESRIGASYNIPGGAAGVGEFLATVNNPNFSRSQAEKMMKNFMPQAETSMRDVNESVEGVASALQAQTDFLKETVGMKMLDAVNLIKTATMEMANNALGRPQAGEEKSLSTYYKDAQTNSKTGNIFQSLSAAIENRRRDRANGATQSNGAMSSAEADRLSKGGGFMNAINGILQGSGLMGTYNNANLKYKEAVSARLHRDQSIYATSAPDIYAALTNSKGLKMPSLLLSSLYRTPEENAHTKGASATSNHMKARAADFGLSPAEISAIKRGQILPETQEKLDYLKAYGTNPQIHKKGTATHIHADSMAPIMPHEVATLQY